MEYQVSLTCALLMCAALWKVHVVDAQIIEHPADQTIPIETNATFHCTGTERPVWIIKTAGGVRYTTDRTRDHLLLPTIGFFPQNDSDRRVHLTVLATVANNNTNISCRVFVNGVDLDFSSTAKLTVLGPPSSPELSLWVLNSTALLLSWPPPFTWPDYEIEYYSVRMVNTSSGHVTVINVDAARNETNATEYFSTPGGETAQSCSLLIFAVSATSTIGKGIPGNTSGGFPIVPRKFTVDHEVSFQKDGTPQLRVEFVPPYICSFQVAEYSINIEQIGTNETFTFGPEEYSYVEAQSIRLRIPAHLVVNTEYLLTVTAWTVAGSSSFRTNFSTDFLPFLTIDDAENTEIAETTDAGNTDNATDINTAIQSFDLVMVVGSVVGSASGILLIMTVAVLCLILFCVRAYKKSRRGSNSGSVTSSSAGLEVQMYETIDKYQNHNVPHVRQRKESPYEIVNDTPLKLTLPGKNKESVVQEALSKEGTSANSRSQCSSVNEDYYTVMSPAGVAEFQKDDDPQCIPSNGVRHV